MPRSILGDTAIRQEKNMAIVVIALACRAAIRGGLSPELAYSISDMQIMNIDRMTDLLQIKKALYAYEVEYAQRVHQLQKPHERNQYTEKAKDYIFTHLHDQLRIGDIAAHLGVNKDYLSVLFHKTEGITLQDYINREKMSLAEHMLKYSDQRVSEIANILAYSSQSHFCHCFRKLYGMTPLEYRNRHRTI